MNRKQTEPTPRQEPTEFKAVPWVRAVRDAMYEETRDMSAEQFTEYIASRIAEIRVRSKSL
jgi:hypothetical protein